MKANKIIICILSAAVVLSSVAFANPYGEKSRPDSVGDIVFADGTAMAWSEGLMLTDAQKKAAVAVIFYAGTECSNGGERRILGVGLENATDKNDKFAWTVLFSPSKLDGLGMTIESILCAPIDDERLAATATFTGDLDGSDNWQALCEAVDDEETSGKYPAWEWVNAYAKNNALSGEYAQGWYLPTVAELSMLYRQKDTVNAALEAAGGMKLRDSFYWSSSQYPNLSDYAWAVWLNNGFLSHFEQNRSNGSVCAVRAFN